MNFNSIDKKTMFLLGSLLVICLILLFVAFLLFTRSSSETPPLSLPSKNTTPFSILSSTPEDNVLLKPNTPGSFSLTFNQPTSLNDIVALLIQKSIPTGATTSIPVTLSFDTTNTILTVTTTVPLKAYYSYTLTVSEKTSQKQLLSKTYQVDYPLPTAVSQNNLELKTYLPYKTSTFVLSYLPSENVYVFNLISSPSSTETVQEQFSKAKEQALSYIKSKGIDPNSVTIDWRYH